MKNVKHAANFWQIDHQVKNILKSQKVVILPSVKAWTMFSWSRRYFKTKPKEGYFIWARSQIDFPLTTCLTIASPKISQDLNNLLIIDKGIKVKANVLCQAAQNNLYGIHKAQGNLILKGGAVLEYNHLHRWGEKDLVDTDYNFILEKGARLIYTYKNLMPPEKLSLKTKIQTDEDSSSNVSVIVKALSSKVAIEDTIFLRGKDSQGIVRLRLVGEKRSKVSAVSRILAEAPSKGHLDCQGLVVDKEAEISLVPELICKNKDAQITHEASIGKIALDQLTYLRMRGLTEKQAIDLIVNGFLKD